jgi:hypothetical protein
MARKNRVQFQKGLSWSSLMANYGTEEQCRKAIMKQRWPDGFRCPLCGGERHCELRGRRLIQCGQCHRQTSVTAGTIFHSTKLPLVIWFQAIFLLTQSKNGISALELARYLGVSYNTAWKLKHKLMQVMLERESGKLLAGAIQIDDAVIGGARHGGKRGRGTAAKIPMVAAVQTDNGRPVKAKLTRVTAHSGNAISEWAQAHVASGSSVISDGLACFRALGRTNLTHRSIVVGSGYRAAQNPEFLWVNTLLGNVKNALKGTYHSVNSKHVPRYLAEFQYRFNRRFDLAAMIPRLLHAAVRTPPMPMHLLKLAESHW